LANSREENLSEMKKLEGYVALITGAGRGIGAAIALRYAREGATVVVVDLDEANASAVAAQARALGSAAESFLVDVSDPAQSAAMVARVVKRFGRIDQQRRGDPRALAFEHHDG
jgi:NAD(P)-dependent dehydrogenase (short-subunit alcohol dehydrogenase family)